jgi:hypothetical protein
MTLTPEILASLEAIDLDWQLIPIDDRKRPVDPKTGKPRNAWAACATGLDGIKALLSSPFIKAVGVVLGPQSGGLLAIDFDGIHSDSCFRAIYGRSAQELPRTVGWSSGRPSRRQLAFYVPTEFWDELRGRRSWEEEGQTCLELRWIGHQSVIAGAHPDTAGYRWLEGCSPAEVRVAIAPDWLLEPLFKAPEEAPHQSYQPSAQDADRATEILQHITPRDDYDSWLKVGMALHSVDPGLLSSWVEWSRKSANFDEQECLSKWKSFKSTGVTIGTLFFLARQDGWIAPYKAQRPSPLQTAGPEDHYTSTEAPGQSGPSAAPQFKVVPRVEVRKRLEAAYDNGLGSADFEILIAELADASDQHPAALRMLLSAIRHDREQILAVQAEHAAIALGKGTVGASSLTLEQLFPEELARALRTVSRSLPYVDHGVAMAYLAGISGLAKLGTSVCGNVITAFVVPVNLYVATVAKSGQKKTPLEKLAIRTPTRELRSDIARHNTRAIESWKDQCRNTSKKEDRPPMPTPMHLHIQDYTGEALTALLCEAEKRRMGILVLRDELAGLFGSLNAYRQGRGGDEQQLLELYDGNSFTSLRVSTSDRSFDRCHVSIYGGIQPDVLRELIKGGDPSGKWARFIFSPLPPITAALPTSVTPADLGLLEDADRTLMEFARKIFALSPNTYNLDQASIEHFSAYELGKQQQALDARIPAQGALCGKSAGKVLRVAGLLHVIRVAAGLHGLWDDIPLETLTLAIALVDHLDAWSLRFHEVAVGDGSLPTVSTLMRRIHEIAEKAGEPVGWKQIMPKLTSTDRKTASAPLAAAAMAALQELQAGIVIETSRGSSRYQATGPLIA